MKVDIRVITDFDVFQERQTLQKIIQELGSNWNDIEQDWQIIKNSIDEKKPELLVADIKDKINNIFSEISNNILPAEKANEIVKLLKKTSAWSVAKTVGKLYIPSG